MKMILNCNFEGLNPRLLRRFSMQEYLDFEAQAFMPGRMSQVIKKIVLVATNTLVIFGLIGQYLYTLFKITIPAFQIAGGITYF
jgi:hypothetical protein